MLKAELFHANDIVKLIVVFPQTAFRTLLKTALNGGVFSTSWFKYFPLVSINKRLTGPRDDLDMVIKQILLLRTEIKALRLVTMIEILHLCLMTQKQFKPTLVSNRSTNYTIPQTGGITIWKTMSLHIQTTGSEKSKNNNKWEHNMSHITNLWIYCSCTRSLLYGDT